MKIALLGDTALYGKFSLSTGNPFEHFQSTANLLKSFDIVVLNLETPFADERAKKYGNKSAYIKSIPSNIELLKFLNVRAVNLANNHIFDYGRKAYLLTKKLLVENDIEFFGTEDKQYKVEIKGNRLAFTGYCCYSTNPLEIGGNGVNSLNYPVVKKNIEENLIQGYNNIVSIHAGQEHVNYPNIDHIKFARQLSKDVPYVLYGHHPHVLQGIEKYNNSVHFFSLGNFCFDDVYTNKSKFPLIKMSENNKSSIIAILDYENNRLVDKYYIPLYDALPCSDKLSKKIIENVEFYSNQLNIPADKYNLIRNDLIHNYLSDRKQKRNLRWYFKRINYNTFKMILNARKNAEKYKLNLLQYLDEI